MGAGQPRTLGVPGGGPGGRPLRHGLPHASRTAAMAGDARSSADRRTCHAISADGKHVIVIGGGDTGSDCVGTSIRQGAALGHAVGDPPQAAGRPQSRDPLALLAEDHADLQLAGRRLPAALERVDAVYRSREHGRGNGGGWRGAGGGWASPYANASRRHPVTPSPRHPLVPVPPRNRSRMAPRPQGLGDERNARQRVRAPGRPGPVGDGLCPRRPPRPGRATRHRLGRPRQRPGQRLDDQPTGHLRRRRHHPRASLVVHAINEGRQAAAAIDRWLKTAQP